MKNYRLGREAITRIDNIGSADAKIGFDMSQWGNINECGMSACIGGHIMLAAGYTLLGVDQFTRPDGTPVDNAYSREVEGLLGMTEDEPYYGGTGSMYDDQIWFDDKHGLDRFRALVELNENESRL